MIDHPHTANFCAGYEDSVILAAVICIWTRILRCCYCLRLTIRLRVLHPSDSSDSHCHCIECRCDLTQACFLPSTATSS